ncbi:MAG: hypothetical protein AAGM22_05300 [Acidobacteriota bacterium]
MKRPLFLAALVMFLGFGCDGRLAETVIDTVHLADSTQVDTTDTGVTATRDPSGRAAVLLSAFYGLDDALPPISDRAICAGAGGQDGMPVVFSHEVDASTMQAGDFKVLTRSGAVGEITCVTLAPAEDVGEARTALLAGRYGSAEDPPVSVEVVGHLLSIDGQLNFRGAKAEAVALEDGPTLVWSEVVPETEWELGKAASRVPFGGGSGCPEETQLVVRATWNGGITKPGGGEVGEDEALAYHVTFRNPDGTESIIVPFALADLGDGDNNHELCLDRRGEPLSVKFHAGLVTDPREDLNPETQVRVTR